MLRKDPFVTGEYYHIYNRGIDKRLIYKSNSDYQRFETLLYLGNSAEAIRLDDIVNKNKKKISDIFLEDKGESLVSIGCWCIMPNHFHILVRQEVDGGITKFMKKVGTAYSMYFNKKYDRKGALFGGLFKSKHVGDDKYMRHLFGYIHLNPLDIKFKGWQNLVEKNHSSIWKRFLDEYKYSSYFNYCNDGQFKAQILNTNAFPEYFSQANSFNYFIDSYLSFNKENEEEDR